MADHADVRSIDALRDARAAVAEFRSEAQQALGEASADVDRTLWWLQTEQKARWQHEIRRCEEAINHARSELHRAELQTTINSAASTREQKSLVEKAVQRRRMAEEKLQRTRHWANVFEREINLFRGQLQSLGRLLDHDLPKGEGKLQVMHDRLERYLRTTLESERRSAKRTGTDAASATDANPDPGPEPGPGPGDAP